MFRALALTAAVAAAFGCSQPSAEQAGAAAAQPRVEAVDPLRAKPLAEPGAPASFFPAPARPVAEIVSSVWNSPERRDEVDEAGQLVRALEIRPGMTIADIGAGAGYHTLRLAPVVGPSGRVIAQDVEARYLTNLAKAVRAKQLGNVTLALGDPHDPRLPAASVDLALLVHMYHEVEQPYAFLYNLAPALKPGGRVAVVDLDRETSRHGTPRALLRCEMAAVGYRQVSVSPLSGEIGYLAVFEPPASEARPEPRSIKACRGSAAR
ncbi:MAG TPA: methyltransferase domain-containing protein [Caulobacteraceae bacterium]|jgi:predicted methyltransferase